MGLFDKKMQNAEYRRTYAQEAAMIDASEALAEAMETSGITRSKLADLLGVSKSEITARLAGERNITVRKLADTLHAMGYRLEVSIESYAAEANDGEAEPKYETDQFQSPFENIGLRYVEGRHDHHPHSDRIRAVRGSDRRMGFTPDRARHEMARA